MKRTYEVSYFSRTTTGTVFLGLSIPKMETEDTTTEESMTMFQAMLGGENGLLPEKQKKEMLEKMTKAAEMQRERFKRDQPAFELDPDVEIELSIKEFEELGSPKLGDLYEMELAPSKKESLD